MRGEEVFVPKLPSYNIIALAKSINSHKKIKIIGIRKGEKLHEELISSADLQNSIESKNYFTIYPLGGDLNKKKKKKFFRII